MCHRKWLGAILHVGIFMFGIGLFLSAACNASPNPNCPENQPDPAVDSGGPGLRTLLKDTAIDTKWAEVPPSTRAQLQTFADRRLAAFRARWDGGALARKAAILINCPTADMTAAVDDFYRKGFYDVVPDTFSLRSLKSSAFATVLVRNYLGTIAAKRASLTYSIGTLPNRDWDGQSMFDSVRLPDRQAYEDIKQFNASVVRDMRRIDKTALGDVERALWERVLFTARAQAVGAFSGDSLGGADMETACEIVSLNNDVLQGYVVDKGRPKIFATDDAVLQEINAIYLHDTELKWLDVGTFKSATTLTLCNTSSDDDVKRDVGDPSRDDVAKAIILLKRWWIERVSESSGARSKCSVYSEEDRTNIWEAFSADQMFNNDETSSMRSFKAVLEAYRDDKLAHYRAAARSALDRVFPDDAILSPAERRRVYAAINQEKALGLLPAKIADALDAAQGAAGGAASRAWNAAVAAHVQYFGGDYAEGASVRAADSAAITAMAEEVKDWMATRYRGYPIDVAALLRKIRVVATASDNSGSDVATGDISIGVRTKRSRMEYYSLIIHELRHAVSYVWSTTAPEGLKIEPDRGPALEGSGVAAEALLLDTFLREMLHDDLAYALYALHYAVRDARMIATTDATLAKYFRSGCSGDNDANTIDFSRAVAKSYGLPDDAANAASLRAHAGTNYFQYITGSLQMLGDIAYLQGQIDASGGHVVDPFVLFACGLNNPRRDATYVNSLRACMGL
jgi:hypothetical protein